MPGRDGGNPKSSMVRPPMGKTARPSADAFRTISLSSATELGWDMMSLSSIDKLHSTVVTDGIEKVDGHYRRSSIMSFEPGRLPKEIGLRSLGYLSGGRGGVISLKSPTSSNFCL